MFLSIVHEMCARDNYPFITDIFYSEHFTIYVIEYGNIWQQLTSCSLKLNFLVHIFFLPKQAINFAFTKHINHKDKNPSDYPWDSRLLLNLYENHKNVSLCFTVNHQYKVVFIGMRKIFQLLPKLSDQHPVGQKK